MDSLIFELQIVFYFQLFLSANVRHTVNADHPPSRSVNSAYLKQTGSQETVAEQKTLSSQF